MNEASNPNPKFTNRQGAKNAKKWPIQGKIDEISELLFKGLRIRCWEDGNIVSLATRVPSAGAG